MKKPVPFLDIDLRTIFAFVSCLLFCSLDIVYASSVSGTSNEVDLGLVDFYRPLIQQLPVESPWNYTFSHFEEIRNVICTCQRGQLLGSAEMYEFIQQLFPTQLDSLVSSLFSSIRPNLTSTTQEHFEIVVNNLKDQQTNCVNLFATVALDLSLEIGIDIDISNQPLDSIFSNLLEQLDIPLELQSFYAIQILQRSKLLYLSYADLLSFIHFL